MDRPESEPADAPDTREEILEATFRALSKHGYADLRMRDIGAEFDKSRTLVHYHFEGKHDLVSAFLEYLIEQYEEPAVDDVADPWAALESRIDRCLFGPDLGEGFDHWERMTVYHELFSQARHDERHREVFADHYETIRGNLTRVVRVGVERGVFRPVDPEDTAQLLADVIHAARARKISLGHDDAPEGARRAVREFVFERLRPPDGGASPDGEESSDGPEPDAT